MTLFATCWNLKGKIATGVQSNENLLTSLGPTKSILALNISTQLTLVSISFSANLSLKNSGIAKQYRNSKVNGNQPDLAAYISKPRHTIFLPLLNNIYLFKWSSMLPEDGVLAIATVNFFSVSMVSTRLSAFSCSLAVYGSNQIWPRPFNP